MKTWMIFLVLAGAVAALFCVQSFSPKKYGAQMVLAKEIRKAMDAMMADLRNTHSDTIKGVPADGEWYHSVTFDKASEGTILYEATSVSHELRRMTGETGRTIASHIAVLNIRRQPGVPDVFEVQLQAKNQAQLISNFKVRTRD